MSITEGTNKLERVALKSLNFSKDVAPICRTPLALASTSSIRKL
ncbi:hypothetical protein [Spirosoma lituiforme]